MAVADNFISNIEQILGKKYLHYHSYISANNLHYSDLNILLNNQKYLFTQRFNALNTHNNQLSYNQISKILKDWETSGQIGSRILEELNKISIFQDGMPTQYGTSAGVGIEEDISIANARTHFNKTKKSALESVDKVCTAVNKSINNIIKILADNKEYLLAEALMDIYYKGKDIVPADLGIPSNTSLGRNLIAISDTKITEIVNTIRQNIDNLSALNNTQTKGEVTTAYSDAVGSIKASFNSLGGTIHEMCFAFAALRASQDGEELLKKTNDEIRATVESSPGGKFFVHWSAQDTAGESGKESKDDVTITYNNGNITVDFGGSIKLRQGQGFKGTEAKTVSGFTARDKYFIDYLRKLEIYSSGVTEAAASMVAALGYKGEITQWYDIKQRAAMLSLVDSIAGSGLTGDFSSILVVNNKIFSITDILNNIGNTLSEIGTKGAIGKGYTVQGADLIQMQSMLREISEEKDNIEAQALSRNRQAWEILETEKISISLNLGYLFNNI